MLLRCSGQVGGVQGTAGAYTKAPPSYITRVISPITTVSETYN